MKEKGKASEPVAIAGEQQRMGPVPRVPHL